MCELQRIIQFVNCNAFLNVWIATHYSICELQRIINLWIATHYWICELQRIIEFVNCNAILNLWIATHYWIGELQRIIEFVNCNALLNLWIATHYYQIINKSVSKSCHFHIRDIRRICHLLPLSAATALANSLVSSKLDYCNSLYSGISQVNLNKLQRIQNSLARVITNTSKYQHITPILKKLHWLPIKQRIDYKLCLLTYKTLTNQQPTYLYNSLSFPSHSVSTRSSDSLVLSIPYVRSSLGKRAFSVIGPRLWNSLPPDTRNSSSLPIFRSGSKHTSSKLLSLPRLFPISLDCLPGFWFLLFSFYALSNDT